MNLNLLETELRFDEGVRYDYYLDSKGIKTIGVGHNCTVVPLPASWSTPLSNIQVNQLLAADIQTVQNTLDSFIPWWTAMDDVRMRALANLCFNMGWKTLSSFNTFLSLMRAESYESAATDLQGTAWYGEVGTRGPRICTMISTGTVPPEYGE